MKQRLGIALAFVAIVSVAACSGGGGGGGAAPKPPPPTPEPTATATPNVGPTPVRTKVVTTQFDTAGIASVPLPVSNGYTCALTIPPNDVIPPAKFVVSLPAEGATLVPTDPAAAPPPYSVIQSAIVDWKTDKEVTFTGIPSISCSPALPANAAKYVTPNDPNSLLPTNLLVKHADGSYGIQEVTNASAQVSSIPLGVL